MGTVEQADFSGMTGNPRWLNYCRVNGHSDQEQLDHDRKIWPGGVMVGYTTWNTRMINRFKTVDLNSFVRSGNGLALTDEGHRNYDTWLTAEVDKDIVRRAERMAEDAKFIRDRDRWPLKRLRVKSQPWVVEANGGRMCFGAIYPSDMQTVHQEAPSKSYTYGSIESLVKTWSVD
jgi:hypothetical protein